MSTRRRSLIVMLLLVLVALAGCGGNSGTPGNAVATSTPGNAVATGTGVAGNAGHAGAASLAVNEARVTVEPNISRIPINQKTRFTIKLTSATGSSQPLQVSFKGAPDSYPLETRGKSLRDAFPGCPVSAIINVDTSTPGIDPVPPLERSLDDNEDDWIVDVIPQSTGTLTLSGEIDVEWKCSAGGYSPHALVSFQQPVTIFDPHPIQAVTGKFITNPWVIAIGSGLIIPIIGGLAALSWKRFRKPKEISSSSHAQVDVPKTETNTTLDKPAQDTPAIEGEQHTSLST